LRADEKYKTAKDMFSMLWDTALKLSGFSLSNAFAFRVRINWMVAVAPDVVDQLEELSLIVDFKISNFARRPSEDFMGYGRGAGTWFI
jgi:hypothetical protein